MTLEPYPYTGFSVDSQIQRWTRGPHVQLTEGWIELDPRSAELYSPLVARNRDEGSVLLDLIDVTRATEAVPFVRKWGLLHKHSERPWREPWAEWDRELGLLRGLVWVHHDLRRVEDGAITEDDLEAKWGRALDGVEIDVPRGDALRVQLSAGLASEITRGLEHTAIGIHSLAGELGEFDGQVEPDAATAFELGVKFPDLLAWAYWELAQFVVQKVPMRACETCSRIFPVEDPRQRYCSNRCSYRARRGRWERKQRKEVKNDQAH